VIRRATGLLPRSRRPIRAWAAARRAARLQVFNQLVGADSPFPEAAKARILTPHGPVAARSIRPAVARAIQGPQDSPRVSRGGGVLFLLVITIISPTSGQASPWQPPGQRTSWCTARGSRGLTLAIATCGGRSSGVRNSKWPLNRSGGTARHQAIRVWAIRPLHSRVRLRGWRQG